MNTLRQSWMLNLLLCLLNYCPANFAYKCEQISVSNKVFDLIQSRLTETGLWIIVLHFYFFKILS